MRRAEDLGGVHDAAYPLVAPDVARLARANLREEVRIPHLVVRVIDLRARRLEPLHILDRPRLRHHLADPATRKLVLDGLDVLRVELDLVLALQKRGHAAAGDRVGAAECVGRVNALQRGQHVGDGLDAGIGTSLLNLLAVVVVDIAELALFFRAEILTDAEDGQVDQIAPLDHRRDLGDGSPIRQLLAVVRRQVAQPNLGDRRLIHVQPERAIARRDAIGRGGIQSRRDDGATQVPWPAAQRDLFRRMPLLRLVQFLLPHHIKREDEVRLRLMLARRAVLCRHRDERVVLEAYARAQQIGLQDRLARQRRMTSRTAPPGCPAVASASSSMSSWS